MKKEKLSLKELEVSSFTTSPNTGLRGGATLARTCIACNPTEPFYNSCGDSMNQTECYGVGTGCVYK